MQHVERNHDPGYPDDKHRQRNGDSVPQSNGWKGLQDGASPLLLQA
jgi:hypothetical protein